MEFSGQLPMQVSRARAIAACHKAENLQLVLPVTGTITQQSETRYSLVLTPSTPILKTALPGTLQVTPVTPGAVYDLQGEAKLWGFGGITLQARLEFSGEGNSCTLTYAGTVDASGLLARVIKPREEQIRTRVKNGFSRLRQQIVQDEKAGRA